MILPVALFAAMAVAADSGLRDPTRPSHWFETEPSPVGHGSGRQAELRLQGTFNVAGELSAMINGRRVQIGEQIGSGQVVSIADDRVVLRIDGETVEIAAAVPAVKSRSSQRGDGQ
jgi:hypothetical protein